VILRIDNLKVEKAGKTICRVSGLAVDRGRRVAIVGPNGCGKTTLLRVVAGLEPAYSGHLVCEVPRRARVYVHQSPFLFRGSVWFNVTYAAACRRLARRRRHAVARRWLAALGIEHLADRRASSLSAGEQRRVALARAFATDAELLLLDEPLAELDEQGARLVCEAIASLEATVLISSPVPLPENLCDEQYSLSRVQ